MQIEKLYQELAGYSYTYTAHMHPALLQGWQRRLYPHCIGMHGMEMEPWRRVVDTIGRVGRRRLVVHGKQL